MNEFKYFEERFPTKEEKENAAIFLGLLKTNREIELNDIALSEHTKEALSDLFEIIARGELPVITPIAQYMTITQASRFLNIGKDYLKKLVTVRNLLQKDGKVKTEDMFELNKEIKEKRIEALKELDKLNV